MKTATTDEHTENADDGFEVEREKRGASRSRAPRFSGERRAAVVIHAITQDAEIEFRCALRRIHTETENYLARLARAASEGRAVDEANNFLRWLNFSGVTKLLELYADIEPKFRTLRSKADELQEICKPYLQGRNIKEHPCQSRIDEVNDKVDTILAFITKRPAAIVEVEALSVKQLGQGGVQ